MSAPAIANTLIWLVVIVIILIVLFFLLDRFVLMSAATGNEELIKQYAKMLLVLHS